MIKIYESIAKWAISKLHDEFIKRGSIVLSTVHLEVKQHQIHDIKDKKEFYFHVYGWGDRGGDCCSNETEKNHSFLEAVESWKGNALK